MDIDEKALATLGAKDEIRELVLLYSRAVDLRDIPLMRTLYTKDGFDNHAGVFSGSAEEFFAWLGDLFNGTAESFPIALGYSGHHVCNHLISIDSENEAHGEVQVISHHLYLPNDNSATEAILLNRWLDHYRKEDGRWRFARRDVMIDHRMGRSIPVPEAWQPEKDPNYELLPSPLFARGHRP